MEQKTETKTVGTEQLAAIRVRGLTGIKDTVEDTLKMLKLYRKNYCSVVPNNPVNVGMLNKTKDYITWGEIDDGTFKTLVDKRGEEFKERLTDSKKKIKYNKFITANNKKIKKYFRLSPPRKGFERKGIKKSYQVGGALGYRGDAINNLIKRMI